MFNFARRIRCKPGLAVEAVQECWLTPLGPACPPQYLRGLSAAELSRRRAKVAAGWPPDRRAAQREGDA